MAKVLIQYNLNEEPFEFTVGKLVSIQHPYLGQTLPPKQFLSWINGLAEKGLIFHGEYDGRCIFRVDGAVIEQLKTELELTSKTRSEYVGCDGTGNMYRDQATLYLHLDGDCISEVSLP